MDDNALLKAIGNLDPEALTSVFEDFAPILFKYVLRLVRNPEEADDVVGEVFARLLNQLQAGKGPRENLRAYLYQTAYHIIVDRARESQHYSPFELDMNLPNSDEELPPEVAEERRILDLVYKALNTSLTDDQKHVIILRFLEEFDLQETADILGKEVNNIKVIQHRALTRLRETLDSEIEDL